MKRHHQLLTKISRRQLLEFVALLPATALLGASWLAEGLPAQDQRLMGGAALLLMLLTLAALASATKLMGEAGTRLEESERQLDQLLNIDELSGALSRRSFLEELDGRLERIRAAQFSGKPSSEFTLMLLDVDHFKHLNDSFGHSVGDEVLRTLVACAAEQPNWIIGRLGGDEFAMLVGSTDHRALYDDASRYAERLMKVLRTSDRTQGYQGISIGIATAPSDATSARELLHCADVALYDCKRNGRGKIAFYNQEMQRKQTDARQMARDLHAAILLNELDVYYQPIVDFGGRTVSAEALVRWNHPVGGAIAPDRFIPVAEQSELIDRLGEWVFRRVCESDANRGFGTISVNVSGAQLKRGKLVPMLRKVLRETRRSASDFALEITETVIMNATPEVLSTVRELREMGFLIALDDFGTGNSSFSLLRTLPVDIIKIDKSYTQQLKTDSISQVFVTAVGEVAKLLSYVVVAEGVETQEHAMLAKLAGAGRFQGYLYGKPIPLGRERLGRPGNDIAQAPSVRAG
ncbi:diguanylate cyclase (GGDEF)-like protein [Pseudorhizobium tarimense]|uniref:Diguanylate cyclase (GGDEF)-like protein n=1 Tax=Pseudorhizobium tarimense TaxID=1079109 RepID=A0ABV2H1Y2_9HYPH|nr:bifunctional diguanylate cyclase/phosphodiesterase [Pseudorhizobium tarimense]MCJ8517927.1 bifunctional diguanylate cyclase/phosphodiesterase [Pseudorhizobium tarimense]